MRKISNEFRHLRDKFASDPNYVPTREELERYNLLDDYEIPLHTLFDAPELYKAYPNIRNITVFFDDLGKGMYAAYDPENDLAASINPFTNHGVAAALFVIILCTLYTLLFDKLGYVLVSACISIIIMWLIGKRDLKIIVPISIIVPLIMWFIFYKLLTVNIPMGVLQPLRDLVDKL